jgi:hypothetical protein
MKRTNHPAGLAKSGRAPLPRALVDFYWRVGARIRSGILAHLRAGYGQEIVVSMGRQLHAEFGRSFSRTLLLQNARAETSRGRKHYSTPGLQQAIQDVRARFRSQGIMTIVDLLPHCGDN